MLRIEINTGKDNRIAHNGDPVHLAAELSMAAGIIYQAIGGRNPFAALMFKTAIQAAVSDDAPTWEPTDGVTTVVINVEDMRNGQVQSSD